jgi:hypothetical protein
MAAGIVASGGADAKGKEEERTLGLDARPAGAYHHHFKEDL